MAPRSNRNNNNTDPLKCLPDAFKAFSTGWKETTKEDIPYEIILEGDFHDLHHGKALAKTLTNMKDQLARELVSRGLPIEAAFIFEYLLGDSIN